MGKLVDMFVGGAGCRIGVGEPVRDLRAGARRRGGSPQRPLREDQRRSGCGGGAEGEGIIGAAEYLWLLMRCSRSAGSLLIGGFSWKVKLAHAVG